MADNINKLNISEYQGGLHNDNSPVFQPKGTYRFALNAINESANGDMNTLSNEESNQISAKISEGFTPLGKCYIGNGEHVILSVNKTISEIGILTDADEYIPIVNDKDAVVKLNFKLEHQIQIEFRLRRGCERTIYFTDNFNKPRYFNIDKTEDFKDSNGKWNADAFKLFKEYKKVPRFQSISVLNSGGSLLPGSYSLSIQYLDESMNPTKWITTSDTVKIFNDSLTSSFSTINGSINSKSDYLDFGNTSKAIEVVFANLDETYKFYRVGIIESNNGSGQVSAVKYSDIIPISNNHYIYTGENAKTLGTVEEILFDNDIIEKAGSILQIENRLLLGELEGKQIDYCKLQQYASRIKTDCVIKEVFLNNKDNPGNMKNAALNLAGKGYMPGEIYSFAVVYLFEDGTESPAYHIPGKGSTIEKNLIYNPGQRTKPMMKNNQSKNNRYFDNESCSSGDYWGLDCDGVPLKDTFVRHHRFPRRSEIGIPLVEQVSSSTSVTELYRLKVNVTGTIDVPITCPEPAGECTPVVAESFLMLIKYTVDGFEYELSYVVNPSTYQDNVNKTYNLNVDFFSPIHTNSTITVTSMKEIHNDETQTDITPGVISPKKVTYTYTVEPYSNTSELKLYKTNILGVKFSGVDLPSIEDTNGNKIVGYYIVRNERTRFEKTILDTGVLLPSVINSKYVSHGLLQPEIEPSKISKNIFGLVTPRFKFNQEEISEFTSLDQEGNFDKDSVKYGKFRYNDVYDGTSFDKEIHKIGELEDENNNPGPDDGWSLKCIVRDTITKYRQLKGFSVKNDQIKELFYLNAVQSRDVDNGATTIYNITSDNRVGILQTKTNNIVNIEQNTIPYVLVSKDIADSYSNFRILPYYKETLNPIMFSSPTSNVVEIFHGDTYVQSMRYVNSVFWDNTVAERAGKTSVWSWIVGSVLVVIGAVLTFFTAGASTLLIGAGISLIGGGALFLASGIERDAMIKAYNEEYKKGLRETTLDSWVDRSYKNIILQKQYPGRRSSGPMDDEIRWISDCVTDLWFDTDIDIAMRNKVKSELPTYLASPGKVEDGNIALEDEKEYFGKYRYWDWTILPISDLEKHLAAKLTTFDSKRKDSRLYLGAALGEYYNVNSDYNRTNKEKIFYHLPLEYDCCSDCKEKFPHRIRYSEQSYQEELTDNYRVFLPNNYRDIEGETGEITNMFKINNNLFIHTREALWQIPRNYQERVTDQIVSFIGTGSYFEIPPQKVLDDSSGNSAGCQHKWSNLKTPQGVYFVTENQNKIYKFDGNQLNPISDIGISNWLQNNMKMKMDGQYYDAKKTLYPYRDNPSNPYGSGYISVYDALKDRVLFTKKDYVFDRSVIDNKDFELSIENGVVTIFRNFSQIISGYASLGWIYIGIKNSKLAFEKRQIKTKVENRELDGVIVRTNVKYIVTEYIYIDGEILNKPLQLNNSWTLSYSDKYKHWISYHSYIPNFYLNTANKFYSFVYGNDYFWKHSVDGQYHTYYNVKKPFIIDYVVYNNQLITKIYDTLYFQADFKKFIPQYNEYVDLNNVFFNKIVAYNSRQCTGELDIIVKDNDNYDENYLYDQISNTKPNEILVDRNERTWALNSLRDIRTNYNVPIWDSNLQSLQDNYFIDKILTYNSLNYQKDWTELESLRDKYLAVRLIFDKFADVKLLLNFSLENETQSWR